MPRIIAQNRIPRNSIYANRITKPVSGGAVGGPVTAPLGRVAFSATPILTPGFKRSDLCTDADIAGLRAAGVLPSPMLLTSSKGYGAPVSALSYDGATNGFDNAYMTGTVAYGDGWIVACQSGSAYAGVQAAHIGYGSGVRLYPVLTGVTGAVEGISYCNGEFLITASGGGLFGFTLSNKSPLSGASIAVTNYSATPAGGSASYNHIFYYKGVYIAYSTLVSNGALALKYSTDKNVWTNCVVPTVNAGSGGFCGAISAFAVHPVSGLLVGFTGYGEIFTSPDGITFTKTVTRAGGQTVTVQIASPCFTPSGHIFAGTQSGNSAVNSYQYTPDINTAWTTLTLAVGAWLTSPTCARWAAYHLGVLWLVFPSGGSGNGLIAGSYDEGVTWFTALPAGTVEGSLVTALASPWVAFASDGFIWLLACGGGAVPVNFVRIDTDWGRMTAPIPDLISGTLARAYVKVA